MSTIAKSRSSQTSLTAASLESEILDRYANGSRQVEPGLCCPTAGYDKRFLELLPAEIIEKDYGCGDPSAHVNAGEVVVDLGSGTGKICYILAQKVGPKGYVIGLDFNDAMLALARKYAPEMAGKLGYRNFKFCKAKIQDMRLDLELADQRLLQYPVGSVEQMGAFESYCDQLRQQQPLIADEFVDVIVSNCVLNLVRPDDKRQLFREMHRVLKRGGRAVISDIVCDETPSPAILNDPALWSGCIAGAFREDEFLRMFEDAGFYGMEIVSRGETPWQVIDGIEFRSLTVKAFKGKEGACWERNQAVVYRGPWKQVQDDDGHVFHRGQRMAVCDKTFQIMTGDSGPYARNIIGIPPLQDIPLENAKKFACHESEFRHPRQSKGQDYYDTQLADSERCSSTNGDCC